ncbi:transposase [Streptomyces sp. NBC_01483]|uniref:transposase n=1 Tax=Streptomyces sp. NBC_01483 TaxID=2903883 RepID=UPI002E343C62|nr:transposase [Streptomyces sp. NBC_01483]
MGSKQRTYTPEFREGAVRIVIETGRPIPEVAEELGVPSGTLHSWVSRWRRNGSASSDQPVRARTGRAAARSRAGRAGAAAAGCGGEEQADPRAGDGA